MNQALTCSAVAVLLLVSGVACKRKAAQGQIAEGGNAAVQDDKQSVCLLDGLGLRDVPGKGGKYISSVSLGEQVRWTGDKEKDEAGKDYVKVELSDGKKGWTSAYGIVTGSALGAIKDETVLYRRPDVLTASNQKLPFMNLVAVIQEKEGWIEVVSEGKRQSGWVKKETVLRDKENVTVAVLATRKLREKDGLELTKKWEAILANTPFPATHFASVIRERAAAAAAPVAVEVAVPEESAPSATEETES